MEENWCAFCLCILKNVTPDQAIAYFENKSRLNFNHALTDKDMEDMLKLREEYTYQAIGDMYGLTSDAVFHRLKRYKEQNPEAKRRKQRQRFKYSKEASEDMINKLCNGYTYKQVSELYGIEVSLLRMRMYQYRLKLKKTQEGCC